MGADPLFREGSSEFPHDNPALDRGVLWLGTPLCAPVARPVAEKRRSRRRHADPPPAPAEPLAVDLAEIAAQTLQQAAEEPPPAARCDDPSDTLVPDFSETGPADVPTGTSEMPDLPLSNPRAQAALDTLPAPGPEPEAAPQIEESPARPPAFTMYIDAVVDVTREHGGIQAAAQVARLLDGDVPDLGDEAVASLVDGQILERETLHPTESFLRLAHAWKTALSREGGDLSACGETTLDDWTADLVSRLIALPAKANSIRRDLRRHGIAAFGLLD